MPALSLEDFAHDFRQNLMASAEAKTDFSEAEFTRIVANELIESGVIEDITPCHYRATSGSIRVDGYWVIETQLTTEKSLDLFITDFANRETLESLTQTEVTQIFKRVEKFFTSSAEKNLHLSLEETSPGYDLALQIDESKHDILKVNFYLLSERVLSDRVTSLPDKRHHSRTFTYQVWDISRLHRLYTSKGAREAVEIDFTELMDRGLPCLPAYMKSTSYKSYLAVIPGKVLAQLYEQYGSRLLEQNVRSFLQARASVNKGIRATIINDPEMFFAYNNGITATARAVETVEHEGRTLITSLTDLQIVNGGQTTASLFHTHRQDKAPLDKIFVQMKLSIVDEDKSEQVVPKISEYANTQNKVNAADFFSNHPFHVRMEEQSRRYWAPPYAGALRETKWFYERARGQYADAQNKLGVREKRKFQAEYPKNQMFTKTDLAKFENVWDDKPTYVNFGAQKNFAAYANRIGQEWEKNSEQFNEHYYKRAIGKAIIFKKTEDIVWNQPWYNGGYRANIVAYTLAMLSKVCSSKRQVFDHLKVWHQQDITPATRKAIEITSKLVHDDIMNPGVGVSNVGEWCKKDACWVRLQTRLDVLKALIPTEFFEELVDKESAVDQARDAAKGQRVIDGIQAQTTIVEIPAKTWSYILDQGQKMQLYSERELGVLRVAIQIPKMIPTEQQSFLLLEVLEKAKQEAIYRD